MACPRYIGNSVHAGRRLNRNVRTKNTMKPMHKVPFEALKQIPFLDTANLQGRAIPTLSFYDGTKWHFWMPTSDGLNAIDARPAEGDYFSRTPERPSDIYMEFLNFMVQRAYWPSVAHFIDAIRNDIHNLGASLQKYHLFHHAAKDKRFQTRRFASTEIEYVFGTCRSMFDLLQEVIAFLWDTVRLDDQNAPKRHLPKSFRKMVIKDGRVMSCEEIRDMYRIPKQLADFYARTSSFFAVLRQYRDNIIHHGKSIEMIFVTERGFAVSKETEPFASFNAWQQDQIQPNGLASIRPALAHVVIETIKSCEDFAHTIQRIIRFPPDIAPGFRLFLRGYHNEELILLESVKANSQWWDA